MGDTETRKWFRDKMAECKKSPLFWLFKYELYVGRWLVKFMKYVRKTLHF